MLSTITHHHTVNHRNIYTYVSCSSPSKERFWIVQQRQTTTMFHTPNIMQILAVHEPLPNMHSLFGRQKTSGQSHLRHIVCNMRSTTTPALSRCLRPNIQKFKKNISNFPSHLAGLSLITSLTVRKRLSRLLQTRDHRTNR